MTQSLANLVWQKTVWAVKELVTSNQPKTKGHPYWLMFLDLNTPWKTSDQCGVILSLPGCVSVVSECAVSTTANADPQRPSVIRKILETVIVVPPAHTGPRNLLFRP